MKSPTPQQNSGACPPSLIRGGTSLLKGVRGIPTMLLFRDGELASTKVGATTKSNIQDWIKENL